jgi:hypothetical protein
MSYRSPVLAESWKHTVVGHGDQQSRLLSGGLLWRGRVLGRGGVTTTLRVPA